MKEGPVIHVGEERFAEACDWFVRLREHPDSVELVAGWLRWYRSDARNPSAFEEVRELWQATDFLTCVGALEETGRVPFQQPPVAGVPPPAAGPVTVRSRPRRSMRWHSLAAAAAVILAAGINWTLHGSLETSRVQVRSFATAASEHRSFSLPDGSRIELAGDSRLKATLRANVRDIELLQGEAYFQVAHDKARPFIVHTESLHVRAVGTSFDVRTSSDRVVVAVAEGMVLVEHRQEPASAVDSMLALFRPERADDHGITAWPSLNLRGGEEVAVGLPTQEVQRMPIEPAAVASWREGRLRFAREPLRSVISSIRAATGRDIEIADPRLGELRFTGTVFSSHVDSWVDGLPAIFPVQVRQEGAQFTIVPRE